MSAAPARVPDQEIQPFHELHGHELLRHKRKTPTLLYGIFVELARQFYSNPDNHPLGTPIKVWDPDAAKTQIWIDTEHRWEDEHPEMRPAIYVQLGDLSFRSLTGRTDGKMGGNLKEAETTYSRNGTGTVSFVHLAGTSAEACALADSTMDYLDAFGGVIRDDFCFTSFQLVQRSPRKQMPKESKERYASVVTFSFEFQDRWVLKQETQRLKVLTFRAGQRLLDGDIV